MKVTAVRAAWVFHTLLLLTVQSQNSFNLQEGGGASLLIDPNRLQFFDYESISLSCAGSDEAADWRVMKTDSSGSDRWETSTGSMIIKPAYVSHSGEYVCEDEGGNRSKSVNISITAADVILVSPALPVVEGEAVSLSCRRKGSPSNLPADFYKDGSLINTGHTGSVTIRSISASDGGFYKCSISGSQGESAESWLQVTAFIPPSSEETTPAFDPQTSQSPVFFFLRVSVLMMMMMMMMLVVGLLQCRKHRGCWEQLATERKK
ncbi:sialoadhesin-like isoform X2 [Betta splendens]|uniref:Sialoadhesin-like isoform X2 n=1 Tax=Betta splendens TaxID=158456 RepID=A0A6P7KVG2_BETSP|nr:sialoadhesin-like isoform X2 [Betta splendens]